jgi:hypothetical protein
MFWECHSEGCGIWKKKKSKKWKKRRKKKCFCFFLAINCELNRNAIANNLFPNKGIDNYWLDQVTMLKYHNSNFFLNLSKFIWNKKKKARKKRFYICWSDYKRDKYLQNNEHVIKKGVIWQQLYWGVCVCACVCAISMVIMHFEAESGMDEGMMQLWGFLLRLECLGNL